MEAIKKNIKTKNTTSKASDIAFIEPKNIQQVPVSSKIKKTNSELKNTNQYIQPWKTLNTSNFISSISTSKSTIDSLLSNEKKDLKKTFPRIKQPTGIPSKPLFNKSEIIKQTEIIPYENDDRKFISKNPTKLDTEVGVIQNSNYQPFSDWLYLKNEFNHVAIQKESKTINTEKLPNSKDIQTDIGQPDKVDLTGDSNPNQIKENKEDVNKIVTINATNNLNDSKIYRGEKHISPQIRTKILGPQVELSESPVITELSAFVNPLTGDLKEEFNIQSSAFKKNEISPKIDQQNIRYEELKQNQISSIERTNKQIEEESAKTTQKQEEIITKNNKNIGGYRNQWRKENHDLITKYDDSIIKDESAVDTAILDKTNSTNNEISSLYQSTQNQINVEAKKADSEAKTESEKKEKEAEEKSIWELAIDSISSFFDTLKKVLNLIFERLRNFVKESVKKLKKLTTEIITSTKNYVISAIRNFGEKLKKLSNFVLQGFPKLNEKFNKLIDDAIDVTINLVTQLAYALELTINTLLDTLGYALDLYLRIYQESFKLLLDALCLITEVLILVARGLYGLSTAIYESPSHWESQLSEEFLGQDMTIPIPELERTQEEYNSLIYQDNLDNTDSSLSVHSTNESTNNIDLSNIKSEPIKIESLDPELQLELLSITNDNTILDEQSINKKESLELLQNTVSDSLRENEKIEPSSIHEERKSQTTNIDRFKPYDDGKVGPFYDSGERTQFYLSFMLDNMLKEAKSKWQEYKPTVILSAIGVGIVLTALIIFTGGAILAFLPLIIQGLLLALTIWSLSQSIPKISAYFKDYAISSWPATKDGIETGAKKFIRGIALALLELIDLIPGVKGITKGFKKIVSAYSKKGFQGVRTLGKSVIRGSKMKIVKRVESGRTIYQNALTKSGQIFKSFKIGLQKASLIGVKNTKGVVKVIKEKFKYLRKIRVRIRGLLWQLGIDINPFYVLIEGKIRRVDDVKLLKKRVDGKIQLPKGTKLDGGEILTENVDVLFISRGRNSNFYKLLNNNPKEIEKFTSLLGKIPDKKMHGYISNAFYNLGVKKIEDVAEGIIELSKKEGFLRVIMEAAGNSGGPKMLGATFVLGYLIKHNLCKSVLRFEDTIKLANGLRIIDVVMTNKMILEFKNWTKFHKNSNFVNQFLKDVSSGKEFKWIFSSKMNIDQDALIMHIRNILEKVKSNKNLMDKFDLDAKKIIATIEKLNDKIIKADEF